MDKPKENDGLAEAFMSLHGAKLPLYLPEYHPLVRHMQTMSAAQYDYLSRRLEWTRELQRHYSSDQRSLVQLSRAISALEEGVYTYREIYRQLHEWDFIEAERLYREEKEEQSPQ